VISCSGLCQILRTNRDQRYGGIPGDNSASSPHPRLLSTGGHSAIIEAFGGDYMKTRALRPVLLASGLVVSLFALACGSKPVTAGVTLQLRQPATGAEGQPCAAAVSWQFEPLTIATGMRGRVEKFTEEASFEGKITKIGETSEGPLYGCLHEQGVSEMAPGTWRITAVSGTWSAYCDRRLEPGAATVVQFTLLQPACN
jgi:hypothetical protein